MNVSSRRVPPVVLVGALLVVLLLGLGGGYLLSRATEAEPVTQPAAAAEPSAAATPEGRPVDPGTEEEVSQVVAAFLDAEAAGDHDASFALLTAADRDELGPESAWTRAHAHLPPITGHEILAVRELDGRTEVVTDVTLASTLNAFVGLVPARGRAVWAVEEIDGGWAVSFTASVLEPRYPSAEGAPEAALAWAGSRQSCDPAPPEHGEMLGTPSVALALCGSEGRLGVGAVEDLPEGDESSRFVAAYGPDVFAWSRVVPVTGPVPLRAVLAPIDDRWIVIGVIR